MYILYDVYMLYNVYMLRTYPIGALYKCTRTCTCIHVITYFYKDWGTQACSITRLLHGLALAFPLGLLLLLLSKCRALLCVRPAKEPTKNMRQISHTGMPHSLHWSALLELVLNLALWCHTTLAQKHLQLLLCVLAQICKA